MRAHLLPVLILPLLAAAACGGSSHGTSSGMGGGGSGTTSGSSSTSAGTGGQAPGCGTDAWVTYGHDASRTGASDGCVEGPLTLLWGYSPAPPDGKMVNQLFHPLATKDQVYLHWSATAPPYTGTTAADRVTLDGTRVWTWDSGTDTDYGDWASLWKSVLAVQSDGLYYLDQTDGHSVAGTGVDWWGQSIPTDTNLLLANTSKSDGPGLFVAAMDDMAHVVWKQNEQGTMCGQGFTDQTGGIALDGSTLFYAPLYASGSSQMPAFASGLYAFDNGNMGKALWNVATTPASAVSAGGGLVFLGESQGGSAKLVARKQSDGSIAWSADVMGGLGVQAPLLAGGKVIVASNAGSVLAFDAKSGNPAWTAMVSGAAAYPNSTPISNGCSGLQPAQNLPTTTMAAALGSGTLIVVSNTQVSVLSLANGAVAWQGTPMGVTGYALVNPVVVGDRVYVVEKASTGGGRLLALQGAAK
jgi:hypothetical protein